MAIVEMSKMRLLALRQDKPRILNKLQKLNCVQVIGENSEEYAEYLAAPPMRAEELSKQITRLDWAIAKLAPYDPIKGGMFATKPVKTDDDILAAQAATGDVMSVVERLEEIERSLGDMRSREARYKARIAQLMPWERLNVPLEQLRDTKHAHVALVSVPVKTEVEFTAGLGEFSVAPSVERISDERDAAYYFAAMYKSDTEAFNELLKRVGGAVIELQEGDGTPALKIDQLFGKLSRIEDVRVQLERETAAFGSRSAELKLLRDSCDNELKQLNATQYFAETQNAFMLTAWAPKAKQEKITKAIESLTRDFDISFTAPESDEKPPTRLYNNKVARPFESIVKMYSLPDPRGLDPTFIMMPFFICYFGLMVSDAAYGIILGVLAAFVFFKLRGRGGIGAISGVLALGGVATLFWGIMLGGWFGIEDVPAVIGFTPMGEPLMMMGLCLGLGAVQIVTGMLVAMYMRIRDGRLLDALFDEGFWLLLFVGIGLIFISQTVGLVIAAFAALGIIATGGRKKKGVFPKLLGGFGSLYNITSYLSDILSYARLFGMGLATGVVAMVMNKVAMMLWGGVFGTVFAIVILIGGHTFNLCINALGAYVHSCRLQYIEFFGKFYESGGVPFTPLDTTGKYVDFEADEA